MTLIEWPSFWHLFLCSFYKLELKYQLECYHCRKQLHLGHRRQQQLLERWECLQFVHRNTCNMECCIEHDECYHELDQRFQQPCLGMQELQSSIWCQHLCYNLDLLNDFIEKYLPFFTTGQVDNKFELVVHPVNVLAVVWNLLWWTDSLLNEMWKLFELKYHDNFFIFLIMS